MNELEQTLSTILEKALKVAEQTGEFAMEQAPLLLQEFYMWHTCKYILGIVISVILLASAILLAKALGRKESFNEFGSEVPKYLGRYYNMDARFVVGFAGGGLVVVSFIIFFRNLYNLVFITIAPKLYLIEYFIK